MTTPNLGLSSTSSAAGSAVKFLDWRLGIDGDTSSNMMKIDTWAGQTNGSITALKGGVTYSGSAVSGDGLGYTAVISGSPAYTLGTILFLMVDTTNTGTIGLNINSLGSKNVYKVNKNGVASNVSAGDIIANTYNTFIFTANDYWMWIGTTSSDQIAISGSTNEIVILSGSGITNSGVLISSLVPTAGSYVVLSLNPNLSSEWLLSSGSGITLITTTSTSTVRLDVGATAPLSVSTGSMALAMSAPIVNTSGSVGINLSAPIVNTSGSVGINLSAPIVNSSGSVSLAMSAPIVNTSGSVSLAVSAPIKVSSGSVTLATTTGLTTSSGSLILDVSGVTAGSYNKIMFDTYGRATSGSVVLASTTVVGDVQLSTVAEVSTGSITTTAVTPDALGGSIYGTTFGVAELFSYTTAVTAGSAKIMLGPMPAKMAGYNLTGAIAQFFAPNTSASSTFQIYRGRQTASGCPLAFVAMLSGSLTINQNNYNSKDTGTPFTVDGANDDILEGDFLRLDVVAITPGSPIGCWISPYFAKP